MKLTIISGVIATIVSIPLAHADPPSSFGSGFDVQGFYKPFSVEDITPENMQK